jgi:metal-dependent amidase/aminoacylase/carboxypeptidase family protein
LGEALAPMPEEPEKAINLLWAVDEIIIALQKLRERLRRMAQQDGLPPKPRKTGKA